MRKNCLKTLIIVYAAALLIAGCRKEPKDMTPATDLLSKAAREDRRDECRLVSSASEFGTLTYSYNQRGLVDEYDVPYYGGYFKMNYDEKGRLVKSRLYSGGAVVNTILFFYHDDHVVKESWYDGDTQVKVDEVFYTFNKKGKVIKSQSFMQDYGSTYTYTPDGNVSEWDLYIGGIIGYTQQYTYLPLHHKDPFLATPGLDYDFTAPNGWITKDKWYSTSEKDISYDETGSNPEVILDQDPGKTIVHFNEHNYVTTCDFYDNLSQDYVHFIFDYVNCGPDNSDNVQEASRPQSLNINKQNKFQFSKIGSVRSIREQVKALRKQNFNRR